MNLLKWHSGIQSKAKERACQSQSSSFSGDSFQCRFNIYATGSLYSVTATASPREYIMTVPETFNFYLYFIFWGFFFNFRLHLIFFNFIFCGDGFKMGLDFFNLFEAW